MDEQEKEEILYRLDERTKKVDENLTRLSGRVAENERSLDEQDDRITSNRNNLSLINNAARVFGVTLLALMSGGGALAIGLI